MQQLTDRQKKVFEFVSAHSAEQGHAPTVREIAARFDVNIGAVQKHLKALVSKGFLEHRRGISRGITPVSHRAQTAVPVLGRIHAGVPLEQFEAAEDYVYVDKNVTVEGSHFALKVKGDSMTGAGILDGDTVVVRMQAAAAHNDIVVALIDGEATLKRLKKEGGKVYLKAENPAYRPIKAKNIEIVGKVIYLVRAVK